jgi:hypothetical protein
VTLRIVSADERLARPSKINIAIFGPSGVGKTTQARTLDPATTLFVDLEAGTLALQDWRGDVLDIRQAATDTGIDPWELTRAIGCLLAGPDPADHAGPYSRTAFDAYAKVIDPAMFAKYSTIFVDSITVASRLCFAWSQRQPQAFSEKTGKPDIRSAYGLLGQEMVRWLTTLQHIPGKSIIVVGILDRKEDDLGRVTFEPQVEGGKTARELPGIFDQVLTLADMKADDGKQYRAFVTQQMNPMGFPAKDRSGRLDPLEPPDLGRLMQKIRNANTGATPVVTTTAQDA